MTSMIYATAAGRYLALGKNADGSLLLAPVQVDSTEGPGIHLWVHDIMYVVEPRVVVADPEIFQGLDPLPMWEVSLAEGFLGFLRKTLS